MLSLQQMFGVGPARNQEFESFAITSYLQAADKSRSLHSLRTTHVTSHLHREFEIEILHHLERSTDPATARADNDNDKTIKLHCFNLICITFLLYNATGKANSRS